MSGPGPGPGPGPATPLPLQTDPGTGVLPVAGTFATLALLLSVTTHVAARNVLGDVPVRNAFAVGPVPAAIAVVFTALSWPSGLAVVVAVAADALLIGRLYDAGRRLALLVTLIHAVVSVLVGTALVAGFFLLRSAPG